MDDQTPTGDPAATPPSAGDQTTETVDLSAAGAATTPAEPAAPPPVAPAAAPPAAPAPPAAQPAASVSVGTVAELAADPDEPDAPVRNVLVVGTVEGTEHREEGVLVVDLPDARWIPLSALATD